MRNNPLGKSDAKVVAMQQEIEPARKRAEIGGKPDKIVAMQQQGQIEPGRELPEMPPPIPELELPKTQVVPKLEPGPTELILPTREKAKKTIEKALPKGRFAFQVAPMPDLPNPQCEYEVLKKGEKYVVNLKLQRLPFPGSMKDLHIAENIKVEIDPAEMSLDYIHDKLVKTINGKLLEYSDKVKKRLAKNRLDDAIEENAGLPTNLERVKKTKQLTGQSEKTALGDIADKIFKAISQ